MILHVDMDAFYASVEERENPELVGRPLIVGGDRNGRGVVAAANYVARQYGVHSAMPSRQAFDLCPQLISLRPRMEFYAQASRQIREIFFRFTPLVEPLSLDEAFLDVAGCEQLFGNAVQIALKIKQTIRDETRLVASVGVAPNKYLAKIASDLEKPDALVVVDPHKVQEFLDPLSIRKVWGIGRATESVFEKLHVSTIADLRGLARDVLESHFGSQAEHFYRLARGIDDRRVIPDRDAKSISHERTFETDLIHRDVLRAWALELTGQVARRLRRHGLRGHSIHVKIRFADFQTITRSQTLKEGTHATDAIWRIVAELLDKGIPTNHRGIRLLGVGVSQLDCGKKVQRKLFDDDDDKKQGRLDTAADEIQDRFGFEALGRASDLLHDVPQRRMHTEDDDIR